MRPMMFAQTIVELPKYGARRREAAISVASVPAPPMNTTTPRRVRLTVVGTGLLRLPVANRLWRSRRRDRRRRRPGNRRAGLRPALGRRDPRGGAGTCRAALRRRARRRYG